MRSDQNKTPRGDSLVPLIQRAKSGDQRAYTELYEETEREVYRTVRAMIRSEELARDVEQEVYVYAFTHLDSLREPEKLPAWLRSIAVNQSHMALRQKSPVLFSELDHGEGGELPEVAECASDREPELTLERKETTQYVNEILDSLTDGQRVVVAMYYYEQIPVSEIARDLGVTPGTVKTQLFRSRKKIEAAVKRLEEQGVKLLGLAPLPFLVALLKKLTPAAEQSKAVITGALTETGVAPAAEAVGIHLGRRFFETVLGKVVLGVMTAAAIGGGVAGFRWYQTHINIGDVRPTETFEINLHYDTDEDLATEPTAETEAPTAPETAEDLVPETADSVETTEPTDPEETTDPVGVDDHGGASTDPTEPGDHSGESSVPSETAQPETEPIPSSAEEAAPRVVFFQADAGGDSDLIYDLPWGSATFVKVIVENGENAEAPQVTTDNPDILRLTPPEGPVPVATGYVNAIIYTWDCELLQSGTAHVYCSLNGEAAGEITIDTPEYPDQFLSAEVRQAGFHTTDDLAYCYTDTYIMINTVFQGRSKPELSTDNPDVFQFYNRCVGYSGGSIKHWSQRGWFWDGRIIGPGDANLYLKLNGEIVRTWTVHAVDWETENDGKDETVETGP